MPRADAPGMPGRTVGTPAVPAPIAERVENWENRNQGHEHPSHADPQAVRARLRQLDVRATFLGDRLRVGFHYFNDVGDVARVVEALR